MKEKQKGPGPRWLGDQPRKRFNVVLDPAVKEEGEKEAKRRGISFSMWMEEAAKKELGIPFSEDNPK